MANQSPIRPLLAPPDRRVELESRAPDLLRIDVDERTAADLELLGNGGFSPLEGFLGRADYDSVVERMRLASGAPWSIPITLAVSREFGARIGPHEEVALWHHGRPVAVMVVRDRFEPDKAREARYVYRTEDAAHPGVAALMASGDTYLGGPVEVLVDDLNTSFGRYRFTPAQLREQFEKRGWRRVVAFQTRNPIHRAHEYLTKCALEMVDGLLIHPLVGETKGDDIPADVRMKCYEVLLEKYYPRDRTMLAVFPAAMRYAGPREAIFHALVRRNYGCTHFIVGRDHAGVGNYYGTYDAQLIFNEFKDGELGITPVFFDHTFYCKACYGIASEKTCVHDPAQRVAPSGTKVRQLLRDGQSLPTEFSRPEVARILLEAHHPELRNAQAGGKPAAQDSEPGGVAVRPGFVLWFTGLSGAGKSTIAEAITRAFDRRGVGYEVLDGDVVRTHLSKGLGFSKEDRDTNIRRIGWVARTLAKHGAVPICAAISPYRNIRDEIRRDAGRFVEVYVKAPLEVCESRDVKGLYKKARAGELKGFTGIDDPYEEPVRPEVVCETDKESVEESAAKIVRRCEELGYLPAVRTTA